MTKKELADINIGMTFDFIKQLLEHPEIVDTIKDGAEVNFIDKDTPIKEKSRERRRKIMSYKVGHIFKII